VEVGMSGVAVLFGVLTPRAAVIHRSVSLIPACHLMPHTPEAKGKKKEKLRKKCPALLSAYSHKLLAKTPYSKVCP
jgi:hypothetical protein